MPEPMTHHPPERLLAFLHRELPRPEAAAVESHLGQCTDCAAQCDALRMADERLMNAFRGVEMPGFAHRTLTRLRVQRPAWRAAQLRRRWLATAAAVVLLAAGGLGTYRLATKPAAPPPGANQVFIFLLYQNLAELKSLPPEHARARNQEYIVWTRKLMDDGRYVSASRLRDTRGQIVTPGGEVLPGPPLQGDLTLTGYYVIRARDETEAASIAQSGPHARYGTTVIRRVR